MKSLVLCLEHYNNLVNALLLRVLACRQVYRGTKGGEEFLGELVVNI